MNRVTDKKSVQSQAKTGTRFIVGMILLSTGLVGLSVSAFAFIPTLRKPRPIPLTHPVPLADWPIQTGEYPSAAPTLADVNGDGQWEVLGGKNGFTGAELGIWMYSGQEFPGWISPSVPGTLLAAAAIDLDQDGPVEIVVSRTFTVNGQRHGAVDVWNLQGAERMGWPQTFMDGSSSPPVIADLDGDYEPEILVQSGYQHIQAWNIDGTAVLGWPVTLPVPGLTVSTLTIADIDQDDELEVLTSVNAGRFTNVFVYNADGTPQSGWPQAVTNSVITPLAVGNLVGGAKLEVAVGTADGRLHVFDATGNPSGGWPKMIGPDVVLAPSMADVNGDSHLELLIGGFNGWVYAFNGDGTSLNGWPVTVNTPGSEFENWVARSPSFADIDNDGKVEILASTKEGRIYAWRSDGTLVSGWPAQGGYYSYDSPALADLDGDGDLEVVTNAMLDNALYAWTISSARGLIQAPWPQFHQNLQRTGAFAPFAL